VTTARSSVYGSRALAEAATSAPARVAATVSRRRLGVVVFTAGAGTLATEIAASRLLAPYFGSSTIVWANIIGLILVYLSLGYWLGGKVADRRPDPRFLGWIVLVAALFIAVLPFVSRPVLDVAVRGLDAVSVGAVVGSFFAALALFAVPVTLLGAVSPFAIRLALDDVGEAGTVAGRLYALSTVGSILGTFASALVLIPLVGTQRTMLISSALLVLSAALVLGLRWQLLTIGVAALLFVPAGTIKASPGLLYETESPYQYVQVLEKPNGSRVLKLNEGVAVHSVWYPSSVLTGGEWDMFLVVPPLLGRPVESMLVIGNAGGTIARAYGELYPDVRIDGVEIDPKVTEAGRRFLGLGDNPNLRVITDDGRPFLQLTDKRYDVIVVDAYRQPYIPFYLATEEFFQLARDHLTPGGVLALNVAAVPGDLRLGRAVGTTVLAAFPEAWRWKPLRFNELVLAFDRPIPGAELERRVGGVPVPVQPLVPLFRSGLESLQPEGEPLTDDRAPVEWLTDRMIVDFIAAGGELDESPLPTAP
jgi:spermidine synthase